MPISATEIANLMNVPTEGVGAANQFYAQLRAQKQQHENELNFRRQSQENELLNKMVENNTKGINPHYTWGNQTTPEKTKQAAEILRNPKMPYSEKQAKVYELFAPLAAGNTQAQLVEHTLKEGMPTLKQAYPNLDLNKYEKDILSKAFYDENGQPREIPVGDAFSHPEFDLNNPEIAAKYVTQSGLEKNLPEHFGKAFGSKPTEIQGKEYDRVFTHPSYYNINPQTLQAEVPSVTIRNNNRDYKLLNEQTSQFIPRNKPEYIAAFNMEANKMAQTDPNFKNLDPEDQQRAVDYALLNKYGNANDVKMIKSNDRQKTEYDRQQDALRNRRANRALALSEMRYADSKKEDNNEKSLPTIKYKAFELNNEGQIKNAKEYNFAINSLGKKGTPELSKAAFQYLGKDEQASYGNKMPEFKVVPLNSNIIKDEVNPNQYYRIFVAQDPRFKQNVMLKQYYTKGKEEGGTATKYTPLNIENIPRNQWNDINLGVLTTEKGNDIKKQKEIGSSYEEENAQ